VFANVIDQFHYLKLGLAVILSYVGVKMLLADIYPIPNFLSLAVIAFVLIVAIVASVIRARYVASKLREQEEHKLLSP
jgi:tellurite resistance protein TerC